MFVGGGERAKNSSLALVIEIGAETKATLRVTYVCVLYKPNPAENDPYLNIVGRGPMS